MPSAQKSRQETKSLSEEFNWDKAMDMAENMLRIQDVLIPFQQEEDRRQRKLKEFPKGFHLEGKGYSCAICGGTCSQEETWYDKYGIKCMDCQRAVDRGEIPASCAEDKDTWYSRWEMDTDFGANRHVLKRWIKAGILKIRTIKRDGHEDATLILIEDNKKFLPPKELVKSRSVGERSTDGRVMFHMEPWYRFVDPYAHLKGYGIMDHLNIVNGKLEAKKE